MKKAALITLIGLLLLALPARAQINLLHGFAGSAADGSYPYGSPILSGTTLYGMTRYGGASDKGTIFKMQTNGSGYTVLHEFVGNASDGANPIFGSLLISGSTLYGVTAYGGASNMGTIFKIQTDGSAFTLLHTFTGTTADGANPYGSLILSGTTLYGMTFKGGDSNKGTIFKIQTNGSIFTLLHEFAGYVADGAFPWGSLVISGSVLYGVTTDGGPSDMGTVFKIGTDGLGFTLLYTFAGGPADGAHPRGSLILSDSVLYGMTFYGGGNGYGTVFRIGTGGTGYALLHEFAGSTNDGSDPYGSLTVSGSTLYGATCHGGDTGLGTAFKIQTDGLGFTLLHEFASGVYDGAHPVGGALILSGSILFGMTSYGSDYDKGIVYSMPTGDMMVIPTGSVDFNGDGYSDIAVWRPSNGYWYIRGQGIYEWGTNGDVPVPGDYNGDGYTDIAVWRPADGKWYVKGQGIYQWGTKGDIPVPGDYNADGHTDIAIWRPADGKWYTQGQGIYKWGTNGDVPVPGDYNGDGYTDIAVWRPADGKWYIKGQGIYPWGTKGDIPVPGDYNADGHTDIAIWRPEDGKWYIRGQGIYMWGTNGDVPVCNDYNGDSKTDMTIWRPSNGNWFIKEQGTYQWGENGDVPLD